MNRRSAPRADAGGRAAPDSGAGAIWVLACGALLLVVAVAVTVRTTAVLARHRVEAAADLAALAAASALGTEVDPCAAAAQIATANGATLVGCTLTRDGPGGSVSVRVSRDVVLGLAGQQSVVASARAGREPGTTGTGPQPGTSAPGPEPTTSAPGPSAPGTRAGSSGSERGD